MQNIDRLKVKEKNTIESLLLLVFSLVNFTYVFQTFSSKFKTFQTVEFYNI